MPLPAFPLDLRDRLTRDAFRHLEFHREAVTTEVEDGPAIIRAQGDTAIQRMAVSLILSGSQFVTFVTFAETTISKATAHFVMSVPALTWELQERRVYIEGAQYSADPVGPKWAVSFILCVFPTT